MDIPAVIAAAVQEAIGAPVTGVEAVGGGRSLTAQVATAEGAFFAKWAAGPNAQTFMPEAEGLRALAAQTNGLRIPTPVAAAPAQGGDPGFLITPWIESADPTPAHARTLGQGLAGLHRVQDEGEPRYGFAEDNFIGEMPQQNSWHDTWPAFFRTCRLEPQARWARERGVWKATWDAPFNQLLAALPGRLPATPTPSLVHGDLWGGNVLMTGSRDAALIDPAVYQGHREVDLAMTELFGRFSSPFYAAYEDAWPVDEGYAARRPIYNLYHLLNHLNIFGSGYARSVEESMRAGLEPVE
ncbi:MAG: phosphotransferase [Bacteroidetes bacterium]|jgi:fructosamine-3-kinase|nr:phosphotransferase [Bacteroidota bacterium]